MASRPVCSILALTVVAVASSPQAPAAERMVRPNVLFILVDDLRRDDLGCAGHPFVETPQIDRLAREGVRFDNAFTVAPLCSPSRASILTGLYPHAHGITDNTDRSEQSHRLATFPQAFQASGYETAFIGKWHMGNDDSRRPGFDEWVCLKGQGSTFDPTLNVNGTPTEERGYVTDVLTEHAVAFLRKRREKPFLLFLAHKALHPELTQFDDGSISDPSAARFIPAKRHEKLYADREIPRRPNIRDTLEGKPALARKVANLPPLGPKTGTSDETIRDRLRMLAAVDESTGRLLKALQESRQLEHTAVVFTSDHGYFYGEHGLSVERRLAYEETIRIPLLVRYPPLIAAGSRRKQLVLTLDFAPTLLDLAGLTVGENLHGKSLLPLFQDETRELRRSFLIEYYSDRVFPRIENMGYQAVRSGRWKYIRYTDLAGMDELYDLQTDPYELHNVIAAPAAESALRDMQSELKRLFEAAR
ncbi:MAG: sulfatase [Planctomycetes bacterium]|nr:sulfatase [Planctomycetota bacterium]